ncbi:MAG: hypothetical protein WD226_03155 [Planctomycetota bacterium]
MRSATRVDFSAPLDARARFARLFGAWTLFFLASPGVLSDDGSALLAVVGAIAFGLTVIRPVGRSRRPGRAAFVAEWLAACYGFSAQMIWIWHVVPFGFLYPGLGQGLYAALSGWLARRIAARHGPAIGPAIGAAAGVLALELLRTLFVTPFGLGWQRLAHCGLDAWAGLLPWLGIEGVTLTVAALVGAAVADAGRGARRRVTIGIVGLALLGLAAGRWAPLPAANAAGDDELTLLLVQPGFSQERKRSDDAEANFRASFRQTLDALERVERPVDLVVWGESMLYVPLTTPAARAAVKAGVTAPDWVAALGPGGRARELFALFRQRERAWVERQLLPALPEGTAFASGAEAFDVVDGQIRSRNVIALWRADGERQPLAAKRLLVPFAETLYGFEAVDLVRHVVRGVAGYVPDFQPARETAVLELAPGGPRIGATVCFDNAFESLYVGAGGPAGVDLHLVVSNEAWYRNAFEMDQMIAFTRALALITGRPFARATNSGVTAWIDAEGQVRGRLEVDGQDRGVAGTLTATVPLPADRTVRTPYEHLRTPLRLALLALLAVLLWVPVRTTRDPAPVVR